MEKEENERKFVLVQMNSFKEVNVVQLVNWRGCEDAETQVNVFHSLRLVIDPLRKLAIGVAFVLGSITPRRSRKVHTKAKTFVIEVHVLCKL